MHCRCDENSAHSGMTRIHTLEDQEDTDDICRLKAALSVTSKKPASLPWEEMPVMSLS